MICERCGEELKWNDEEKLYYCWKCYTQIKLDKNNTLFD
jgi:predicted amidophosphoribosyltransferase